MRATSPGDHPYRQHPAGQLSTRGVGRPGLIQPRTRCLGPGAHRPSRHDSVLLRASDLSPVIPGSPQDLVPGDSTGARISAAPCLNRHPGLAPGSRSVILGGDLSLQPSSARRRPLAINRLRHPGLAPGSRSPTTTAASFRPRSLGRRQKWRPIGADSRSHGGHTHTSVAISLPKGDVEHRARPWP